MIQAIKVSLILLFLIYSLPILAADASITDAIVTVKAPVMHLASTSPEVVEVASGQKWWQAILVTIIEAVAAIVVPILSVLFMFLINKWKLKIELEVVEWILKKSIGFAEQKSRNALKAGRPLEGPEIAQVAIVHGTKLLKNYKLAEKFGEWLADGIEAQLGQSKLENVEAPKEKPKKSTKK